ncbi:MAG: exodeoxyribonuclease III [Gammaproteobacteria bacterium]|nr:exodeoxyribonuclease III [Gammaproteobacteria bacterium]
MKKIMSFNANGIRSAARRGFFEWVAPQHIDVLCLQETKIQDDQLMSDLALVLPGYHCEHLQAEKKGYSGVAIYSKIKPNQVQKGLGFSSCDQEGRYIQFDYDTFSVASLYCPSGTSGELRQDVKMAFLSQFEHQLKSIQQSNRPMILCGDYNIAHRAIDLKNWRANQTHTGFLPEERAWMDKLFQQFGFVDAFRALHPEKPTYTWWSQRGQARANDVGWRIDYQVITPSLAPLLRSAEVYREPYFSDHAPLLMEYAIP